MNSIPKFWGTKDIGHNPNYLLFKGINSLSTNSWKAGSNHFSIWIVFFHICIISPCSKELFIHLNQPVHSLSLCTFLFRIWKTCANVKRISWAYATSGNLRQLCSLSLSISGIRLISDAVHAFFPINHLRPLFQYLPIGPASVSWKNTEWQGAWL